RPSSARQRPSTVPIRALDSRGPFVPPVTTPSSDLLVVTGEARSAIEASGLGAFEFRPVVLARVVNLRWEAWDLSADWPERMPAGGEPENYVLRRKDSAAARAGMPDVFEVVLPHVGATMPPTTDAPVVLADRFPIMARDEVGTWFVDQWPRWVEFEDYQSWSEHIATNDG
ncbi:MAG: hypothetical protein KDB33_19455, partial [Acidimicrobiales bacterium]|nr:hypothetical protein [Acidimicrobiales bacterium]